MTNQIETQREASRLRQRKRRATHKRIDYYPSKQAIDILNSVHGPYQPWNNYSGTLNAIIEQWAKSTTKVEPTRPKPELFGPYTRTWGAIRGSFGGKIIYFLLQA